MEFVTPGVPLTSLEPVDAGGISVPHPERWETKPKADSGTIPRTDRIPIFFPKTLHSALVICGLWGGSLELLRLSSATTQQRFGLNLLEAREWGPCPPRVCHLSASSTG